MEFKFLYFLQSLHGPVMDNIMIFFTHLGSGGVIWIIIAAILIFNRRTRKCGLCVILSLVLCLVIGNMLLKNIVCRPRPCWIDESIKMLIPVPKDYSFPSGHTFSSFASATAILKNNRKYGIAAFVLAAIISFSRMYLFVHFPTDIIAGIIMGVLCGSISYKIIIKK